MGQARSYIRPVNESTRCSLAIMAIRTLTGQSLATTFFGSEDFSTSCSAGPTGPHDMYSLARLQVSLSSSDRPAFFCCWEP